MKILLLFRILSPIHLIATIFPKSESPPLLPMIGRLTNRYGCESWLMLGWVVGWKEQQIAVDFINFLPTPQVSSSRHPFFFLTNSTNRHTKLEDRGYEHRSARVFVIWRWAVCRTIDLMRVGSSHPIFPGGGFGCWMGELFVSLLWWWWWWGDYYCYYFFRWWERVALVSDGLTRCWLVKDDCLGETGIKPILSCYLDGSS